MKDPIRIYIVMHNTDNIEGKGPIVPRFIYFDPEDAVQAARGKGPMGVSDDDVVYLDLHPGGAGWAHKKPYYDGYRKEYVEHYNDPEWPEYERLRQKFEGKL